MRVGGAVSVDTGERASAGEEDTIGFIAFSLKYVYGIFAVVYQVSEMLFNSRPIYQ